MIRAALVIYCLAWLPATADTLAGMQSIGGTRHHLLSSDVLGRELHILVKVPENATKDQLYHTVYLLDGGALFPMLAGYYNYLRFEEAVPDLIIVGISYGADTFEGGNFRSTDYTAPSTERDYWGGAPKFQQALTKEILPLVESNYPGDKDHRILFGQSLAGQFVLFNAFTSPETFHSHIASNLAIHRNLDYFLALPFSRQGSTRLFIVSGSDDSPEYATPRQALLNRLGKAPQGLSLQVQTLAGYGHFSLAPEAFRQGLIWSLGASQGN